MQAVILAAGMGKRLKELTKGNTKCMLNVNGKTLIERALESLIEVGINSVVIVVGYKADSLIEFIGEEYKGVKVNYVVNDIYDKTNNIYSLYLAKDYLKSDDTLLLESDLIFDKSVLEDLINNPFPNLVSVAKYESWMDGTVVELNQNFEIKSFISKADFDFNDIDSYYKTVNIYKFSKEFSEIHYLPFLEAYCKSAGLNEYYEQVLSVITFLDRKHLRALILDKGVKWYEIDDKQDLHNAETIFSFGNDKLKSYQRRFGGYWRFPELADFCYLVNPYFPPQRMIEEIKSNFETLLGEYPSGLNVQNLIASKMFNCDDKNILVGNGAAELIKALLEEIKGKVGIIYPTFNEYPERLEEDRIVRFIPDNKDFSYDLDDLKGLRDHIDVLLLINPDNPSGHFFTKNEVMELVDYYSSENKKLILDESFVDFSTEGQANSLIDVSFFSKYSNLYIIKSISKSYGVPGARLGVLVAEDEQTLCAVRKRLSIWNINSFGEFFFQIFEKYQQDYSIACVKIAKERDRLYDMLNKIDYLRPIYSQANYFLCEVSSSYTSTNLAEKLLNDYNIFIKDLKGKVGFEGEDCQYIRIAVRSQNDNDKLIQSLTELEKN
jgi:histidinol-phosphate/aromatic aminotransferase/cobyric acid decarboxylase-like protein/choline kinase